MPARRQRPAPCVQARAGLERARAEGLDFDAAWDRVVGSHGRPGEVVFPHATTERRGWREALACARSEFEAAYSGAPSRLGNALHQLAIALEDLHAETELPANTTALRLSAIVLPVATTSLTQEQRELNRINGLTGPLAA